MEAKAFYATIALATITGAMINFSPVDPIKALYWSAVINGIIAVPVMAMMMLIADNQVIMGKFPVSVGLRFVGWTATATMAMAAVGMVVTALL